MVYVKKLVMHGFKSFAKKTEIIFDKGINVILGPNGSGKSNVADALTFVLGRLSIKSMRASKASNLLFMGSKYVKPSHEASVELVFDNSDRMFAVDKDEISLKRIVRRNGQGIYKINDETKTRAEIIEILAQAGIDPYGFNMVLQGQIQAIVKMHGEDRRKIIEEVAGISIYESRKEKSLHELEKTEEKLKEIGAVLRERTAYLRNLEKERSQAMKFKELELGVKRCKSSILNKRKGEKEKEINSIVKSIDEKTAQKDKLKEKSDILRKSIDERANSVNMINENIQRATGIEQDTLHQAIANLKVEIEGLRVRKENFEHRKGEIERRMNEMSNSVPELEGEIKRLREKSPLIAQKAAELKKKKLELADIEQERKKMLTIKTELNSLRERIRDKERQLARAVAESESLLKQIEDNSKSLKYRNAEECQKAVNDLKSELNNKRTDQEKLHSEEIEIEKKLSVCESEINRYEKIKTDIQKIDVCPLCQSKMTPEHVSHVFKETDDKIGENNAFLKKSRDKINELRKHRENILKDIKNVENIILNADIELLRHKNIKEKHEQLKKRVDEEKLLRGEVKELDEKIKNLENKGTNVSELEEKYDSKMMEIEEISSRTDEDFDTTLLYKERELENTRNIVKRSSEDIKDVLNTIKELTKSFEDKNKMLNEKTKQETELNEKFEALFKKRDDIQREIQENNVKLSEMLSEVRAIEDQVNYLKIGKAKLDAEKEAIEMELQEFTGIEIIQGTMEYLEDRLKKTQEGLMQIGSINMRALEVYEDMKKEYDAVFEKVQTLEKEKTQIMEIIAEIDKKKRRAFMKTFDAMNEIFTSNFSKLYSKGVAYLEMENKESIFEGGVNIVIKLAKGKYFDVTSLSGGEQTLVALSLLFAIQEYKPYHFYIFDEIDAALDKRNSERLSALLTQYMKQGQYIVITHNDAIILNSNILYGVSMHDGVSKILTLKINDDPVLHNVEEGEKIVETMAEEKETKKDKELEAEIEEENIELEEKDPKVLEE